MGCEAAMTSEHYLYITTGGRALQTLEGFIIRDLTGFERAQHHVQLIKLELLQVKVTEERGRKGTQLLGRFGQPLKDRVGSDLEHPCGSANPQSFGQAGQHAHNQLHCRLLAMDNRTMVLRKIAVARGAVPLSPRATTGMAMRPQVVQSQPAAIVTLGVGTKGLCRKFCSRGLEGAVAPICRRD